MKDLSVVIVGGATGLGSVTANIMAQRGASRIGIIDINRKGAEQTADQIRKAGVEAVIADGDVSQSSSAHALFNQVNESLGRVHSLINCAAVYPRVPILEISDEMWDQANAVNVKGTYHVMVAAVKHMREFADGENIAGRIVNIASVDAFKAHPQNAYYAATKAAVVSLTKSFAHACASDQILVNAIAPAGMATEKAKQSGFLQELADANPLGRAATPEEIAEFVILAAGPRNTYMTGETMVVSGGYIYA